MRKWKLTTEILDDIEIYAEDQYSLEETFDELNISKKLMKDEQVLQAYEQGLIKRYIYLASSGLSDEEITDECITAKQCAIWREKYSDEIKKGLQKKEEQEEQSTKQFSNLTASGMINILEQNGKDKPPVSQEILSQDIQEMVEKMQSGDTKAQITVLTTNIMQLQLFNGTITHNLMGDLGKSMDNFKKLSEMQLKVMQETRKCIMAINEITNPKRTTFIKEANQHNHLHQNAEKKDEIQNELSQPKEIIDADQYTEAETITERTDQ